MDEIKLLKKCSKCLENKLEIDFYINRKICKKCRNLQCVEHYKNNSERCKELKCFWQKNNKEKFAAIQKKYYNKNLKKIKEKNRIAYYKKDKSLLNQYRRKYLKNKRKIDPLYKMSMNIRNNINSCIRRTNNVKKSKTTEILNCDFKFFKEYIEAQFTSEMNWDNIHLDHIKPIFTAKTEKDVLDLNHYTNFQSLLIFDNLSKGKKIIEKQLRLL